MDINEREFLDGMDTGVGSDASGVGLQGPTGCDDYEARRLTPTECAMLQGFPRDWCADVPHKDSHEYKLWGNGIALPCVLPIFKNIVTVYQEGR